MFRWVYVYYKIFIGLVSNRESGEHKLFSFFYIHLHLRIPSINDNWKIFDGFLREWSLTLQKITLVAHEKESKIGRHYQGSKAIKDFSNAA